MKIDAFSSHRNAERATLDAKRAAVLVVDMVNDFCKPGGAMVLPGAEILVPKQRSVIDAARDVGAPIVWIHDSHRKNMRRDREFLKRSQHCIEGTWGVEIVEELGALDEDIHVVKHRYSAFYQTDLDLVLKDMMVSQVVVFGVVTNICVRSTVHDAFFNGYEVVVPRDCCAATGPREHESTLYDIATHFGVVSDAMTVAHALRTGGAVENQEPA
ncbi:MAG: isochorismatase family cysteine hydrolase [Hyphomicrobiaceae bacterium]